MAGEPEVLLASKTIQAISEVHRHAEVPEVITVSSVNDLFRSIDETIGYDTESGLPESSKAACASLALLRTIDSESVDYYITEDRRLMRITVHVEPFDYVKVLDLSNRLERMIRDELPGDVSVEASGSMVVIGRTVEKVVKGQFAGFGLCFLTVTCVIAISMRSLRLSLMSLAANMVPLLLLGGLLGLIYDTADSDLLLVFTVCFGIVVDDTVHFLHRYDIELGKWGRRQKALERTFDYTGRAIAQTTLVLCCGMMFFALSRFLSIWILGTYLVIVLVFAVLADMLLLPAMIMLLGTDEGQRTEEVNSDGDIALS